MFAMFADDATNCSDGFSVTLLLEIKCCAHEPGMPVLQLN